MEIVQNILKITKKNKLTDKELCKLLETNPNKIYDWKKGKSKPSAEDILKIADYLDCSVDYLLGREAIASAPKDTAVNASPVEKQIILAFRKADEVDKTIVLRTLHLEAQSPVNAQMA